VTGEPRYPTNPAVELAQFLGVPVQEFNADAYAQKVSREEATALAALLREMETRP
jgi:hypothetical protein